MKAGGGVKAVLALIVFALVVAAPVAGQTSGSAIVAGQSAAGVRIGGSVDEALSTLGSFYEKADTKSGKYTAYAWALRPVLLLTDKESGKIVFIIIVNTDSYRTDRGGITGGTERATVESTYGREFTTDEEGSSVTLIYDALGIAFDIDKAGVLQGRVSQISVFTPGQWKAIIGGL
jgi:hypothetical protein